MEIRDLPSDHGKRFIAGEVGRARYNCHRLFTRIYQISILFTRIGVVTLDTRINNIDKVQMITRTEVQEFNNIIYYTDIINENVKLLVLLLLPLLTSPRTPFSLCRWTVIPCGM